jgi:hypothetical protein
MIIQTDCSEQKKSPDDSAARIQAFAVKGSFLPHHTEGALSFAKSGGTKSIVAHGLIPESTIFKTEKMIPETLHFVQPFTIGANVHQI